MSAIPGPWEVVDIYDVKAGSLRIRQNYELEAYDDGDLECAKDNARLIAAAPELLDELQNVRNVLLNINWYSEGERQEAINKADVILKKAKGES